MTPASVNSPFVQRPDLHILNHRPHKSALLVARALTATALFRIWPMLLFLGGWAAMVVLINKKTDVQLATSSLMLTVWGVLLGLSLTYRTNSAYERYWEGRKMWTHIIFASRNWARFVWIHCPDSQHSHEIVDPAEAALDGSRAVIEKKTLVDMGLAFAVAMKHYLRGEEGIYYEDLYDLVKYIPSVKFPSGIPSPADTNITPGLSRFRLSKDNLRRPSHDSRTLSQEDQSSGSATRTASQEQPEKPNIPRQRPILKPAEDPPVFKWSETFPVRLFVTRARWSKMKGRKAMRKRMKEQRMSGGVGSNIPLEIVLFMSNYVAALQHRKTIDVPTINALLQAINMFSDSLSSLERILTTPIPWSYNAHIWEITVVYCMLLPFQLYSQFGWNTIPATMITAYIVIGFAAIGSEIENPFGYDANDLNLDFFVDSIIRPELVALTSRPFAPNTKWLFSAQNESVGPLGADKMQYMGMERIRTGMGMGDGMRADESGPGDGDV